MTSGVGSISVYVTANGDIIVHTRCYQTATFLDRLVLLQTLVAACIRGYLLYTEREHVNAQINVFTDQNKSTQNPSLIKRNSCSYDHSNVDVAVAAN